MNKRRKRWEIEYVKGQIQSFKGGMSRALRSSNTSLAVPSGLIGERELS